MPREGVGERGQGFWDHVSSLRAHLLWGAAFFVVAVSLVFVYSTNTLIRLFLAPLHGQTLVFLSPLGPFLFRIQLSIYAGVLVSLPVWLGLAMHFVFPALPRRQRVMSIGFALAFILLAALSLVGTYVFLIPMTLAFLLSLAVPGTSLMLTADSYVSFALLELMVVFIVLQLPFAINILSYLGLVDPYALGRKRRFLYPVLLLVLAVATPTTDVVTLLVVAAPAVVLTEIGVLVAKAIRA
jgi:sec-independent protein translocase protein TatC